MLYLYATSYLLTEKKKKKKKKNGVAFMCGFVVDVCFFLFYAFKKYHGVGDGGGGGLLLLSNVLSLMFYVPQLGFLK